MLSVIVPTLNAADFLPSFLDRMAEAGEIILIDGGSSDSTVRIAEEAGIRLVLSPRGRGQQLRIGGAAALGDWLLFLHVDTLLAPGWEQAVAAHCQARPRSAACFRLRLADRAWQARWIERGVALRCRRLGLPYGDQGLLIPKSLYDNVGGYQPLPLMEDVDLVRRIGRDRIVLLDHEAWTSTTRWRRDGWTRRSGRNLLCLVLYTVGISPARIARFYE